MANGENKSRLIELIFKYIKEESRRCFGILGTNMIVLSSESGCVKEVHTEDQDTISAYPELNSNHDEGDTKVILHTIQILRRMWMLLLLYALPLVSQI